jgi:hypothetical protein
MPQIVDDLASELLAEARVEKEIGRRRTIRAAPHVLDASKHLKQQAGFLAEGTIVTLIGRRDSPYVGSVVEAIRSGDAARVQVSCDAVNERARADVQSMHAPFALSAVPWIVDVTYGRSWLAKHVLLSEAAHVAVSVAIWSGGALDHDKLSVWAYPSPEAGNVAGHTGDAVAGKAGAKAAFEVVTILVPPRLSEIERALVSAVPGDLSEIHIKGPSVSWTAAEIINDVARRAEARIFEREVDMRQRLRDIGPFGEEQQQQTTVDQQQRQQDDTKQQQQQQQQADTKQQQQQQQQQQQDTRQQNQQQQQQQVEQNQGKEQNQNQQQQQQQAKTEQQQQQQQQQDKQTNDNQRDQNQVQNQQERQAQTQAQKEQHGQRVHQDAATQQQREWSKPLDDLMREGLSLKPLDVDRYRSLLDSIDFESMDATQSVKALLRLREELLRQGLG